MASLDSENPPTLQNFRSENGKSLASLPTHFCPETGKRYVLWKDIEDTFKGIDYLSDFSWKQRASFMVDQRGEVYTPWRIEHWVYYNVTFRKDRDLPGIAQAEVVTPTIAGVPYCNTQDDTQGPRVHDPLLELQHMFQAFKDLQRFLSNSGGISRDEFLKLAGNLDFRCSTILKEMERLEGAGLNVEVDGKSKAELLEDLVETQQQIPNFDYLNICNNILCGKSRRFQILSPRLFIVLPRDLDSWNDSDPATHKFRLYFLCDVSQREGTSHHLPQHIHISDHQGYNINRPEEFFQTYGGYSLALLKIVKRGFTHEQQAFGMRTRYFNGSFICPESALHDVPALETCDILWSHDTEASTSYLSSETIRPLVDKAISSLQDMLPSTQMSNVAMDRGQLADIEDYLDVVGTDNTVGNLYRHVYVLDEKNRTTSWVCEQHSLERFSPESLTGLKDFIYGHGGHVDMQKATLKVDLKSEQHANQFITLLEDSQHVFDISVKLNWKTDRSYLDRFFRDIVSTGTDMLEIDGLTVGAHPRNHIEYGVDLFAERHRSFVTLLNYPRSQEQCVYWDRYCLYSPMSPSQPKREWYQMLLQHVREYALSFSRPTSVSTTLSDLQETLSKYGRIGVTDVNINQAGWSAAFNLQDSGFSELRLHKSDVPTDLSISDSLLRLTVEDTDSMDFQFIEKLDRLVHTNHRLQELNIVVQEVNIPFLLETFLKMWDKHPSCFRLTLLERTKDKRGRIVAQITTRGRGVDAADITIRDASPQKQIHDAHQDLEFLQWNCDHSGTPKSDSLVSLVNTATRQHSSTLISFTLDVSLLSEIGFTLIQNILDRSRLDRLYICCTPVNPCQRMYVRHLLQSVHWSLITSLVLFGDSLDEWIQLLTDTNTPFSADNSSGAHRLLRFGLYGAGTVPLQLSHSSALFLHRLICLSPQLHLHLENVKLRDTRDWGFIIEAVEYTRLESFGVSVNDVLSPTSVEEVWDLLESAKILTSTERLNLVSEAVV